MSPFIKWPIAALTIIGSIVGAGITLGTLLAALGTGALPQSIVSFLLATTFYLLGLIAGWRFSKNDKHRGLMRFYYALQIPWLSSPYLAFRFTSAANVSAAFIGGTPLFNYSLGSIWHVGSGATGAPWGIGLNGLALLCFWLLRHRKK